MVRGLVIPKTTNAGNAGSAPEYIALKERYIKLL